MQLVSILIHLGRQSAVVVTVWTRRIFEILRKQVNRGFDGYVEILQLFSLTMTLDRFLPH